ncbi:hypothetical protein DCC39_03790 [Pueribacillus theae]|uniref:Leucine-binding protein domain-containing protein n=1 Tax=Pueribacillus theae TaxID=2171751 RepID=A0A2U1K6I4_9BACI|nr:ABC transporter substrate-binding protein [Pueribacillus theae]PWA12779.1 hypothetical protein DCC39_03790 [Pueribacillus theae]
MRTMEKRQTLLFLLVLMLMVGLAACGGKETTNKTQEDKKTNDKKEAKIAQGITEKEILVGHLGPQTGPVAVYDKVRKGLQSYFNYVNDNGGVDGREIKLIAYDDQYQPAQTLKGVQKLVNDNKVFSLLYPIGTANIGAAQSFLTESGIPVVGIGTGADKFANPPIENFFISTFNYKIEAKMFVDYIANKLDAKKVAIVYQNDDFGKQSIEGAKEAIAQYGNLEIVAEIPFLASDTDFSSQAQKTVQSTPDVIVMFTTPAPAANFRKEMHKIEATEIPFLVSATGGSDPNQFEIAGKDVWEGTISSTNISLDTASLSGYEEYANQIKKDFGEQDIGDLSETGWAVGQIFVEAVKRAGEDLTWENLIKQLETFDNWDGSLYPAVTYTPEHRYGNTTLFLFEAEDGERKVLHKMHYDLKTEKVTYDD